MVNWNESGVFHSPAGAVPETARLASPKERENRKWASLQFPHVLASCDSSLAAEAAEQMFRESPYARRDSATRRLQTHSFNFGPPLDLAIPPSAARVCLTKTDHPPTHRVLQRMAF